MSTSPSRHAICAAVVDALARSRATTRSGRVAVAERVLDGFGLLPAPMTAEIPAQVAPAGSGAVAAEIPEPAPVKARHARSSERVKGPQPRQCAENPPRRERERTRFSADEAAAIERAIAEGRVTRVENGEFPDAGRPELHGAAFAARVARNRAKAAGEEPASAQVAPAVSGAIARRA